MALGLIEGHSQLQRTGRHLRQQLLLLGVTAQMGEQSATEDHRLQVGLQGQAATQFGHHQHGFHAAAAKAADLLGKRHCSQAKLAQLRPELGGKAQFRLAEFLALLERIGVAHQTRRGVLQHLLLFSQFEVHCGAPLQLENHLRDDVLLDFVGAAEDRQLAHVEVVAGQRCAVVGV